MVPDLDLQLQVALKALADTIAPAVDPANKMAVEQLQLVIATLTMVRDRLPIARRFSRRLLEDEITMLDALSELTAPAHGTWADRAAAATAQARALLADPEADTADLDVCRTFLAEMTVFGIREACGGPAAEAVEKLMIVQSKTTIEHRRAWCLSAGFEPYPGDLPPIATLI